MGVDVGLLSYFALWYLGNYYYNIFNKKAAKSSGGASPSSLHTKARSGEHSAISAASSRGERRSVGCGLELSAPPRSSLCTAFGWHTAVARCRAVEPLSSARATDALR